MIDNEINHVQFGVASKEYFLAQSVVEINSTENSGDGSIYDERMGPIDDSKCKTCGLDASDCTGHFAHIKLVEPVVNPLFSQRLLIYFGIFCWKCSCRILQQVPKIRQRRNESFISILNTKSKGQNCFNCDYTQSSVTLDRNGVLVREDETRVDIRETIKFLERIKTEDLVQIGVNVEFAHPKNFVLEVLPVIPHINRPFLVQPNNQKCDDDLSNLYHDIVKSNEKAKRFPRGSPEFVKHTNKVSISIQILFNNSSVTAKHPSSGRKFRCFAVRLTGKEGLFRNHCLGKRADQTARAVASPGPELDCDQIGIPSLFAKTLTRPVIATEENVKELQKLCDENNVDRVERIIRGKMCEFGVSRFCNLAQTQLEPGDVIIREKCLPIKVTIGSETLLEGDKIIRASTTIEAQPKRFRKFKILVGDKVSRFLQNGDVVLANRQPTLHTGSMTGLNVVIHDGYTLKFPLSLTFRFNLDFDGDETNIHVPQSEEAIAELRAKAHASKVIISPSTNKPFITVVQDTVLALYLMTTEIEQVDKDLFDLKEFERVSKIRKSLKIPVEMDTLALLSSCLPHDLVVDSPSAVQIVCGVWISGTCTKQTTTYLTTIVNEMFGAEAVVAMIGKWQKVSCKWLTRRGFTIDGDDVKPFKRDYVENFTREAVLNGEKFIRDDLHALALERSKGGNMLKCVLSGAKGTPVNIGQIISTVGQQQSKGGIIESLVSQNRVLLQDEPFTDAFEELCHFGYVVPSFANGLSARDYFLHAIPSRDAVVNSATKTANSGYLQHRCVKILEDAVYKNGQVIYNSGEPKTLSLHYNKNLFRPELDKQYLNLINRLNKHPKAL